MTRFGLIGDVHAEDERLEAALELLATEGVDAILCVGDLSDGKGDLDRCIELLERHRVLTVAGNHDRWLLADTHRHHIADAQRVARLAPASVEYLRALPATRRLETEAGALHLCHGLGVDDMIRVNDGRELLFQLEGTGYTRHESLARLGIDADTRLLVGGHTHQRWAAEIGAITLINPGTLRRGDAPGCALLHVSASVCRARFYDLTDPRSVRLASDMPLR